MSAETIPILPSSDFDVTSAFFSLLGFAEVARYPAEYLIIRHGAGIELHFWLSPGIDPMRNESAAYVRFESAAEARDLYQGWESADLAPGELRPLENTSYNMAEFAVLDPHRNLLRIGGLID